MPQTIIDLLKRGTEANKAERFRGGNLLHLPGEGSLVVSGDIHGHRRNFERIVSFADLDNNADRHLILQEIIHGGPEDEQGGCLSYKLLFDAVLYKLKFPDRVHLLMGNHDIAFINDSKVMKNGKEMNISMRSALEREFKQAGAEIHKALRDFLFSQPLAARCENRIWFSHSLPNDRCIDEFDTNVLERELKTDDLVRGGSAYLLIWGRKHSQVLLDRMAKIFDVDVFVLGHQPQQEGWNKAGNNLIIIASDHNHGCLLSIDLAKAYTAEGLVDSIVPLASVS